MAGRYSKQELKDKLQRSALHLVATEGIERLSTRRLSAGCGLSDPYIYQCYSDNGLELRESIERTVR